MGKFDERQKKSQFQPMKLPSSSGVGRNGQPSDDTPASPPPASSRPPTTSGPAGSRGGQFLRPQLPRFGPGHGDAAAEAEAPPPSRANFAARHGAPPRADDDASDSRTYPVVEDDEQVWDAAYGEEDSYEIEARSQRDPWSRDWGAWSATYLPDEGFEEDEEDAFGGSWRRDAWGGQPNGFTMASVAIQVAPPSRRRAAAPKGPAFQQIMRWVSSGFKASAHPTKQAMRLLLVTSILGVIVLSGLGTALYAYNDYRSLAAEATAGANALNNLSADLGLGKGTTKTLDAVQAQAAMNHDLGIAMANFQDIHNRLEHPDFILAMAGAIPTVRDKLTSALVLSSVAIDAVTMLQKLSPTLASVANLLIASPIASTSTDNNALLNSAQMRGLASNFDDVQPLVAHMVQTLGSVPPDTLVAALNARQQRELLPLLQGVPQLPTVLKIVSQFLNLKSAPDLLGANNIPVAYLIMTLDNTELRPVGGFQGQYAVVGVNGAHVGHISLEDVYHTLEPVIAASAKGQTIQAYNNLTFANQQPWYTTYGGQPNTDGGLGWALRNSGLSADYAQSARYALWYLHNETICNWTKTGITPGYAPNFCNCNYVSQNYTCIQGGDRVPNVDAAGKITSYPKDRTKMAGVIMIQQKVIAQLLDVVGPLKIGCPYYDTVDAAHLQYKIHFYQETTEGREKGKGKCGSTPGLSDSTKRFTALLTQALQAKLKTLPKTQLFKFAGDLINDLHTRDIQIYFTDQTKPQDSGQGAWDYAPSTVYPADPYAETFLQQFQVSSEMYQGTDDSLAMNRADMLGWKMEQWVKLHLIDHIQLDSQGRATHTFQAKYDFNIPDIAVIKNQNGVDYDKTSKIGIFNQVFNAGYGNTYTEYWRVYTSSNVDNFNDNRPAYTPRNFSPFIPYASADVKNRAYFQGEVSYLWSIDPNKSTVQWGYQGLSSNNHVYYDQEPPSMQWQSLNVIHNNQYNLHVQPQSGVNTDVQIDITGPCGHKVVNQPLTTKLVISVPTAHC